MAEKPEVKAEYTSPSAQKNFTEALSTTTDASVTTSEKTAYLSELRHNVSKMQGDINAYLTTKMDEDRAAEQASGRKVKGVDEDKEEQMYGEEDPENDS